MNLRSEVSLSDFLRAVDQCKGDVFFRTNEGDILNLKSQLSKYIFLAAASAPVNEVFRHGQVAFQQEDDRKLLAGYIV